MFKGKKRLAVSFFLLIFCSYSLAMNEAFTSLELKLVQETVNLRHERDYRIDVTVKMKFQGTLPPDTTLFFPETEWFDLEDLRIHLNDDNLVTKRIVAPENHYFVLDDLYFPAIYTLTNPKTYHNPIITTQYNYQAPWYGPGTKDIGPTGYYVEYILQTGRPWKGRVQELKVVLDTGTVPCSMVKLLDGSYPGHCQDNRTWIFNGKNMELERDIRLLLP